MSKKNPIDILKEEALEDMSNEIEFFTRRYDYDLEVDGDTPDEELPLYINEEKAGPVNQALAKSYLRGSKDPYLDPGFLQDLLTLILEQAEREPLSANHDYSQGKLAVIAKILKALGEDKLSAFASDFSGIPTAEIIEP